jgi:predicted nucleotidyltransferase
MTLIVDLPATVRQFLDELVATLTAAVDVEAVYLHGSAASGAFDPTTSDLDVYAVTANELTEAEKQELTERVGRLEVPAQKLELVVYSRAQAASEEPSYELNTGDPDVSGFWFVLDRAAAEQTAVPLVGPPWSEIFAPVPRERILEALGESLDWQERNDPSGTGSVLNTMRALHWLETGTWTSKPAVAAWLREHVRETLEHKR